MLCFHRRAIKTYIAFDENSDSNEMYMMLTDALQRSKCLWTSMILLLPRHLALENPTIALQVILFVLYLPESYRLIVLAY